MFIIYYSPFLFEIQGRRCHQLLANSQSVQREWFVIDAEGQTLGRLTTRIASVLRGKHKPTYTPHVDCGDYVIVINADKIVLTGNKLDQKQYYKYSGYMGGLRSWTARQLLDTYPERIIEHAVKVCCQRIDWLAK